MPIGLAIHGGAWNVPDGDVADHLAAISRVVELAWEALRRGDSALDVVEFAVRLLEDEPAFNAGRGSRLTQDGRVEMDASIMDGTTLAAGAVAAVQRVRHPISLASRVMEESSHVLLVGEGAQQFALDQNVETCRTRDLLVGRELDRYDRVRGGDQHLVRHEFNEPPDETTAGSDPGAGSARGAGSSHLGTVGAVACDREGRVAAATSTGGTQNKASGRVGDSPLIGAGTYADDRVGAVSATGWGEGIIRIVLAKAAIDRMAGRSSPGRAGRSALGLLRRVSGAAGLILVDRRGRPAAVFNTPRMARGLATEADGLKVGVERAMRRP